MFNVTRSETTPESLENKTWRGADVADVLRKDFLDKCYLCESKDPLCFNIEHFDAHKGDEDKKYDWNNLFFACARCNNFKGANVRVLDCTDKTMNVCRLIKHSPPSSPYSQTLDIQPQSEDPLVIETANLIRKIYNEDDTGNRLVAGAYIRKRIFKRYFELLAHVNTHMDEYSLPREREAALEHIRHLMHKKHEFSAFLRWVVLDSPQLMELVGDAID